MQYLKSPAISVRCWTLYLKGESTPYLINLLRGRQGQIPTTVIHTLLNLRDQWQGVDTYGDVFYHQQECLDYIKYLEAEELEILGTEQTLAKEVLVRMIFTYSGQLLNVPIVTKQELEWALLELRRIPLISFEVSTDPISPFGLVSNTVLLEQLYAARTCF